MRRHFNETVELNFVIEVTKGGLDFFGLQSVTFERFCENRLSFQPPNSVSKLYFQSQDIFFQNNQGSRKSRKS